MRLCVVLPSETEIGNEYLEALNAHWVGYNCATLLRAEEEGVVNERENVIER
jgi:hypothetical protein